jgi:hypothetical protein
MINFIRRAGALALILLAWPPMYAQQNILGVDLLGRAGIYSFNFERVSELGIGAGGGFGVLSIERERAFIVPLYISYAPFKKAHSLYGATGITVGISNLSLYTNEPYRTGVAGTITGGYQYKSPGGFLIRPTVTFFYNAHQSFCCWPGVMIGHSF